MKIEASANTVGAAVRAIGAQLLAAGCDAPRLDARLLVAHAASIPFEDQIRAPEQHLSPAACERLRAAAMRRARREPLAHITGEKEFWSLPFAVSADVLIPRPDSEAVVGAVLQSLGARTDKALRILDLGTGSGCLLLALLSEMPKSTGIGLDLSPAALAVATENARRLDLGSRARFLEGDWGAAESEKFDVIVSNPPYIRSFVLDRLAPEIALEPRLAFDGGDDGLEAYRRLLPQVTATLAPRGIAAIEIGQGQARQVRALAADHGLALSGRERDLSGRTRCLVAVRQVVSRCEKRLGNCGSNE